MSPLQRHAKVDRQKVKGKNRRYPIGTVVAVKPSHYYYFLSAYGSMDKDLRTASKISYIWQTLDEIWLAIRTTGHCEPLSIPIIGSDLARTDLPRMLLIKMIVLSFIAASKEKFASRKLTIMIYPGDLHLMNLLDIKDFLDSSVT